MQTKSITLSLIAATLMSSTVLQADEVSLDPIVVGADFRDSNLSQVAGGVSVIDESDLYDKTSVAFGEVIGAQPNVNFSAGASRAKYIQIRGIGERSQFVTPINPSVGIILDGIDLSQNPLGVTLFDVKQIEVLRGPQGTTFGANGMAGVINIQSNDPTAETEGHIELTAGNYNTYTVGAAVGGTLIKDRLLGRLSVYKNSSDGYMKNSYLGRDDTNNIDELTIKGALKWYASENHTIDLHYLHLDIDNGYDAWSLDNSRTTHSDEPGKDTLKGDAFALKSTYRFAQTMHLVTSLSYSDMDSEYSYDEDWSYVGEFSEDLWPYSSFDQYLRNRKQVDADIRLISDEDGRIFGGSTDWTVGAYYKDYSEAFTRNYTYLDTPFTSSYDTTNTALYGQLDSALNEKLHLVAGLRVEWWDASYNDSESVMIDTDETLWGGKIGLNYQLDNTQMAYVTLSKGYKPGGVNADSVLAAHLPQAQAYKTETLWNVDAGINGHYFDNTLTNRLNFFYGKRKDQQVKSSVVYTRPDNSTQFIDYLTNAAEGSYYGLELMSDYYPTDALHLYASVGLLHAEFDKYDDPNPDAIDMNGRAPANSPSYQYNLGFDYMFLGSWTFKANVEGKGSYYFSNRHNEKSPSYVLLNSALEYTNGDLSVSVWGRNLTDKDYYVRGFGSFGNNPAKGYETELYTQYGAPRTFGVTLSYDF